MKADNLKESYKEVLESVHNFLMNNVLTWLNMFRFSLHNWSILNIGKLEKKISKGKEIQNYLLPHHSETVIINIGI